MQLFNVIQPRDELLEEQSLELDLIKSPMPRTTCKYRSICNEYCATRECPAEYFEQGTGPEVEEVREAWKPTKEDIDKFNEYDKLNEYPGPDPDMGLEEYEESRRYNNNGGW